MQTPQNKGRLTGPPMQMGKGTGSMMADGGFGAPDPIGAPPPPGPAAAPPAPPMGAGPDQDGDMDMPMIRPEAVSYHDDLHRCDGCQYMGDGGQCAVLRMAVSPEGGCNAFEAKGGAMEEEPGGMPGEDANDTSEGTSGMPQR